MNIYSKTKKIFYGIIGRLSPKALSRILYYRRFRKHLNLKNPKSFNEKLMWLKLNLYNNDPTVWKCADKYLVREYAKEKGVKEENLPKLIKVYKNADEINFDELPDKFALKCSHGCGFNVICTDKSKLNKEKTKKQLNKWLKTKFGYETAEVHYTHIKPVIICEEYIGGDPNIFPIDYKVFCFNGIPKIIRTSTERKTGYKLNYFSLNWTELNYGKEGTANKKPIKKPQNLNKILKIARVLSKDFPFVRIDFFENEGTPILGEMTFTPSACLARYYNETGDHELSKLLILPKENIL